MAEMRPAPQKGGYTVTAEALQTYLNTLPVGADVLTVTGHPAPDTDTVISALFEAWRLTLGGTPAVPLIQGTIPRETAWLLGESASLVPVADTVPATARLVLTDHHDVGAYAGDVVAVVDHHPVSVGTDLDGIATEIRTVGAATTLVALRLRADGITPDAACARMLLGAILLDTEGLSSFKAKAEDLAMAAWLSGLCGADTTALFERLRAELLSESDVNTLYWRDYRRYTAPDGTPLLGWAILKVWADACPDKNAVRACLAADDQPTRVAKIVLHHPDGTREEHYLADGLHADTLLTVVQSAAGADAQRVAEDTVFLPQTCHHWGRKRYAAHLIEILSKNP